MYTLGEGSLDSVRGGSGVETRGRVGQARFSVLGAVFTEIRKIPCYVSNINPLPSHFILEDGRQS